MKKLLSVGIILLATGCIMFGVLLASGKFNRNIVDEMNFDWPWLRADYYNHKDESFTYQDVNYIKIDGDMLQIKFLLSSDDDIHVEAKLYYGDYLSQSLNANGELDLVVHSGKTVMRNRASILTIYIPKNVVFEGVEIDNEMSEIEIKYIQAKYLDIDTEMANITIEEGHVNRLYVEMSMADFKFTGQILEFAEVSNEMGSITMTLYNNEEEVGYHIKNAMGNVSVGDKHHSGFDGSMSDNEHAPVFLELENSMGEIKVIFRKQG
jgi:hypothetical protein